MKRIRQFLTEHALALFGLGVFLACALWVFAPALPIYACLVTPDSMPHFQFAYRTSILEGLLTGTTHFAPHTLYWLLLPPLVAHEVTFLLDSLILALAGVYYLTGRRVHPLAAWAGGIALGLSGYTFTLFSAGHRGYFYMISSGIWVFGLLIRCFERRRLFHFAMLGLVLSWALLYQPDVTVLLMAVAAAYALWLTAAADGRTAGWRQRVAGRIVRVWPRFAVSLVVLLLGGYVGLRATLLEHRVHRDTQIAGVAPGEIQAPVKAGALSAAERRNRWIFATNWSLPPEDLLEALVPGVFGNDTMHMPFPYWGRLGRPCDEQFEKGRMMPNHRQHTMYLGVIPVLFAVLGIFAWRRSRRTGRAIPEGGGTGVGGQDCFADVPFWMGVWVVCLLLAMGRHTPVYRLFYAIPFMDYLRAPVKFYHLVEAATAFLAAFGLHAFLRATPEAATWRRRLTALAAGLAVACLLGAGIFLATRIQIAQHVSSLGLGPAAEHLAGYAVRNCLRSAAFAAVAAALAAVAIRAGERAAVRLAAIFVLLLASDAALVARRFVRVIDLGPFYRQNAVVQAIAADARGQAVQAINYLTPNAVGNDWFSSSLVWNGVRNLAPTEAEREAAYGRLFTTLQADPARLWQILRAQYVLAPRKALEGLLRAGVLRPLLDFEMGRGALRSTTPGPQSLLLAATGIPPGPRAVTHWRGGVPLEKQPEELRLADSGTVVSAAPPPLESMPAVTAPQLACEALRGTPLALETRVTCVADAPALVLFGERFADDLEVLIDGRPAACHISDGAWASTVVPAGSHRVVLRKIRNPWPDALALATCLALLAWWGAALALRRPPTAAESRA